MSYRPDDLARWAARAAEVDVALEGLRLLAESLGADPQVAVARAVERARAADVDPIGAVEHVRHQLVGERLERLTPLERARHNLERCGL